MIWFKNSKINILFGILENCSAQNFKILNIYNSSLYGGNTQFHNFNSMLIYSNLGFLTVDYCFFKNFNCSILDNESAIKLEKKVSFIFKKSIFQYLDNFAKVINLFFIK